LASLSGATATMLGKIVARTATQWFIGWIPGIGNGVNAATAFGLTETMGWMVAEEFANSKN
jgi:uncharacterized protein (DUF697 family)